MTTNYRALIVDDDLFAREAMFTALTDVGFECETAADGDIADSSLKKPFDVVVTDLRMPRRNGHALAMDVVSRGPGRPLVVVLTGVLEPRLVKDLIARGVDDVNFKPADLNLLGVKIQALCERRQREKQAAAASDSVGTSELGHSPIRADQIQDQLDSIAKTLPVFKPARHIANSLRGNALSSLEIARTIVHDPLLTAHVLRLANLGIGKANVQRVASLEDAVNRVGDRQIGELALKTTSLDELAQAGSIWTNCDAVWRRCLASSIAVKCLNPAAQIGNDDEGLFICALLLPLSRPLLSISLPGVYSKVIDYCQHHGKSLPAAERACLSMTPARAMAGILSLCKFPPRLYKPLQYCGLSYADIFSLTGPVRLKVEQLRTAEFLGDLAVGSFERWYGIEFPAFDTICRLKLGDIWLLVEEIRAELAQLTAPFLGSAANGIENGCLNSLPIRYFRLTPDYRDPLIALVQALGITVEPVSRADACQAESILVNCLDVSPDRLQWFLDDAVAASNRWLVCNSPLLTHQISCESVVQLPTSFGELAAALESLTKQPLEHEAL